MARLAKKEMEFTSHVFDPGSKTTVVLELGVSF
jgi:hypothetical protein